jgi:hypothetical protein
VKKKKRKENGKIGGEKSNKNEPQDGPILSALSMAANHPRTWDGDPPVFFLGLSCKGGWGYGASTPDVRVILLLLQLV